MPRPNKNEYNPYFEGYISLVKGDSFNEIKSNHNQKVMEYWDTIPEKKWTYSYEKGKWTLKQVLQHIIDTERILVYRALCIVREDTKKLSEFDQDKYASSGKATLRSHIDLINEWKFLRNSNDLMFKSFSEEDLKKTGIVGSKNLSVRAVIYIVIGHTLHHINIVNNKYLNC